MLLERRTIEELEELLAERLELLRSGKIGPDHLHRREDSSSDDNSPKPPEQRRSA
jgi:hypothetical protein